MEPKPVGRPKSDNPRSSPVPVRFSQEERELVQAAADAAHQSLSAWIRERSVTAAKRATRKTPN